jgi:hypothetical protein
LELRVVCRSLREASVRICVDGRAQGELRVAPGPWTECVQGVRSEREIARIEIFPEPVVVPAEATPGSRDGRTLGLAVSSFQLAESRARGPASG